MINVAGRPLFDNTVDLLTEAGINDIFVVVGHKREGLTKRIGEYNQSGVNLHYVEQNKNLGIGDAVLKVKDKISPGEYFLLIYGDTITSANIFQSMIRGYAVAPAMMIFGRRFLARSLTIS